MANVKAIAAARQRAEDQLGEWAQQPLTLPRLVYFVPGWTDENGLSAWGDPKSDLISFASEIPEVIANAETHAHFVSFHKDGSPRTPPPYESFIRFGADLAKLIRDDVKNSGQQVDIVCHSMGGLDTVTAVALLDDYRAELGVEPLRCVHTVITLDTPFAGFAASINPLLLKLKKMQRKDEPYIISQAMAMAPNSLRIQEVMLARDEFLSNVVAFHARGAEAAGLMEVPHASSQYGGRDSVPAALKDRYVDYDWWEGTTHSGNNGLTADPRAIVDAVKILTGA
jgi:hypothetical protein